MFTSLFASIFLSFSAFLFGPTEFRVPLRYDIHGIDVSHHQNYIDWSTVAEDGHTKFDISFCFIKATEGVSLNDRLFNKNWSQCKEVGIKRGAYHFFIPSVSAKLQARNYINSVRLETGDLVPVLDFEQESETMTVAQMRKAAKSWLNYIQNHYGVKPIIYTNMHMYNTYIKGYLKNYPLWIADYNTHNIFDRLYNPNLRFWQYSEKGRVKGIKGHVDCNAFLGQPEDLDKLTI
jgi:lysozyme